MDKRVFLKVKLKSLAAEARIIKREEQRRKVPRLRPVGTRHPDAGGHNEVAAKKMRAADSIKRAGRRSRPWYPMSAQQLHELTRHRLDVVRVEARLTGIAYAIVRQKDIGQIDSGLGLNADHWRRIQAMVKRYGDTTNTAIQVILSAQAAELAPLHQKVSQMLKDRQVLGSLVTARACTGASELVLDVHAAAAVG